MNKKVVIISLVVAILLCTGAGVYGFLNASSKNTEGTKYDIKMKYYVDEEEVTSLPKNTEEETIYAYDRYVCTNKVTGVWDNDDWKFTPSDTADSTCKVYFTSAMYEATFNISNGILSTDAVTNVSKGKDGVFVITPTQGYMFDAATCTNEEEIFWDETKNELTVKNIQSDTTCEVAFKLSELEIELTVTYGSGTATKIAQYGTEFVSEVTPTVGYGDPTIACNPEQSATWSNNQFKIANATTSAKCTITFKVVQTINTYTVTINLAGGHATVGNPVTVQSGANANIELTIESGYRIGTITGCTATNVGSTVTVPNVVKNTTCTVNIVPD